MSDPIMEMAKVMGQLVREGNELVDAIEAYLKLDGHNCPYATHPYRNQVLTAIAKWRSDE